MTSAAPAVARKSVTTIQFGSVYKERYVLPGEAPVGTTARQEWRDSAGAVIAEITGEVDGRYVTFREQYSVVDEIPNGAGFYCYIAFPDEGGDEHMVRYGTTFLRQLSFPHNPAVTAETVTRRYSDQFQRQPGQVGGKWRILVGKPVIQENDDIFSADKPNTVGNNFAFFSRYFMRYYVPFSGDTVEVRFTALDRGQGILILALCAAADASSFLYVGINTNLLHENEAVVGYGTGPDIGSIGSPANLYPQGSPVDVPVFDKQLTEFRARYDNVTKKLALYNADLTTEYCSWTDDGDLIPHGKGYRYFGIGGRSALLAGGCQVAYVEAQDAV